MHPDTRHKAIIAISLFIAIGYASDHNGNVGIGLLAWGVAFAILYAAYYASKVFGWVFFRGELGTGLRIIPRTWEAITGAIRSVFRGIGNVVLLLLKGLVFLAKTGRNAHARHQWEKGRPERERQAAEAARLETERAEEDRRKKQLADEVAHRLRVAREAEVTEARTRAELAARQAVQDEVNRAARAHEEEMLAIERERLAIVERRGKRHEGLLNTLSELVEKSKG
jgi:hypothetical protein